MKLETPLTPGSTSRSCTPQLPTWRPQRSMPGGPTRAHPIGGSMPASSWQLPRRSPRSTSLPHSPKSPKPPLRTRTICQISWRVSTTPASPLVPACMSVSCENRMATSSHQCRKPSSNASAAACSHRPLIAIRTDFAPQLALHHRHCQRPDTPNNPPKRRWRRTTNQPTPMQRRPPKRRRRRTTNQPAPTRTGMTRPWRLPHCERVKQQFPEAPGVAAGDVDADAEPTHPHLTLTPHRPTRSRLPPNVD